MARSALMSRKLANREQQKEFLEDYNSPFMKYFMEAEKWSSLFNSDIFAFRDYVRRHPPQNVYDAYKKDAALVGYDLPKSNQLAASLRLEGNKLFAMRNYKDALLKYNESICWAHNDSEDLAIGFANRSAVSYEMEEYEFTLVNIKLARQHNYPQRLMAKLEVRERNCRVKIEAGEHMSSNKPLKLILNVEVNPSIPFLAQGIAMAEYPLLGRGLTAQKDFKVGDVILQERPMAVVTHPVSTKLDICHHCAAETILVVIPCPHCVSVMYCSDDCLKVGWKEYHRFECGIYNKLSVVPFCSYSFGRKVFFYGLTLFNDSLPDMIEYCKANGRKANSPFDLDYSQSVNPMDVFKLLHTVQVKPISDTMTNYIRCVAAILYDIYLENPLIQALFVGITERNFLLETLVDYMLMAFRMVINNWDADVLHLYTLASICNHSCDPNTHAVFRSGQMRFIVIRPISKGEQISIPYGVILGETPDYDRFRLMTKMDFDCECGVCDPESTKNWLNKKVKCHLSAFHQHLDVLRTILMDTSCNYLDKLNAVQQFVRRYAHVHPLEDFRQILTAYRVMLQYTFRHDMMTMLRKRALAADN